MDNFLCPERKSFYFIVNFDYKTFKLLNMVCCEQLCKSFPVAWQMDFRGKTNGYWGTEVKINCKWSDQERILRKERILLTHWIWWLKPCLPTRSSKSGRGGASVQPSTQRFRENQRKPELDTSDWCVTYFIHFSLTINVKELENGPDIEGQHTICRILGNWNRK